MATSYRCENTEYRIVTVDSPSNCDNRLWTWPPSRRQKYVVVIATQTDMVVRRQKLVAVAGSWRELQVMEGWKKILLETVDTMIQFKTVVTQTQRLMNEWLHWCFRIETILASMLRKERKDLHFALLKSDANESHYHSCTTFLCGPGEFQIVRTR